MVTLEGTLKGPLKEQQPPESPKVPAVVGATEAEESLLDISKQDAGGLIGFRVHSGSSISGLRVGSRVYGLGFRIWAHRVYLGIQKPTVLG